MASGLTDFAAKKIVNALMNGASLGAPGTWYLALFTAVPTAAGGGTEASYSGYARLPIVANTTDFPTATGATTISISNGVLEQFAAAGTGASATDVGWGLFDASTGGNMWFFGTMTSLVISSGIIVQFSAGEITLELISTTP
jgi:hypothetical protein